MEAHTKEIFSRLKFKQPDPFHQELKLWWGQQIHTNETFEHIKDISKGALISLILVFSYYSMLRSNHSLSALLFGIITSLSALLLVFNFAHDASHRAVFSTKLANYLLNRFLFLFIGIDGFLWSLRHIRAHHPYTNVIGADPDVSVGKILRVSPHQKHLAFHKYQYLYAVLLYFLAIPAGTWWKDFYLISNNNTEKIFGYKLSIKEILEILFCKILHCFFWVILPTFTTNKTLIFWIFAYIVSMAASSITFIFLAALNHFSEYAAFPEHTNGKEMNTTWSEHQIKTNTDWCANNNIISFWVGGANLHVAHHLLPNIPSRHLMKSTKKIQELAKKYNSPYKNLGFIEGVSSHFRFLKKLGCPNFKKDN